MSDTVFGIQRVGDDEWWTGREWSSRQFAQLHDSITAAQLAAMEIHHSIAYRLVALFSNRMEKMPDMQSTQAAEVSPWEGPVHCSWCGNVINEGIVTLPISHGICPECAAREEANEKHRQEREREVKGTR